MGRQEQFPIDEKLVREFIEENKKQWEPTEQKTEHETECELEHKTEHNGKYIFVNFSMVRMQMAWIIPKLLFAKGLQEASGARPVVITWRANPLLTELFSSFGFEHLVLDECNKRNFGAFLKAGFQTAGFELFQGTGEKLKKIRYRGYNIGLGLYEDILRTSSLSTLRTCRNKICLKKMFHILWTVYALDHELREKPIQYAVTDDMAYHEGILIKLFRSRGADIFASSNIGVGPIQFNEKKEIMRYPALDYQKVSRNLENAPEDAAAWTEQYLEERFRGKNGREIDRQAFSGKKVLSREELVNAMGLDPEKKNVVIMAHTFTDAVFNYGTDYYFRDYYDWADQTLQLASMNTSVNWILKPHPTRAAYNESTDSIENMFARHRKPHMFLLDDKVSGESVKNIADVQITIGGNSGAEYSCFGIPTVIVGKPYYHGFGYTIEPATFEDYKNTLMHIQDVEKLTPQQTETAKKVFYVRNHKNNEDSGLYLDEFANLINGKYKEMLDKMAVQYFKDNTGTKQYNTEILQCIMDYLKADGFKQTDYYLRGKKYGEKK